MIMQYVIVGILALQKVAIFGYNIQMMMIVVFLMEKHWASSQRTCWKWQHYGGFLESLHSIGIRFGRGISKAMLDKSIYVQVCAIF